MPRRSPNATPSATEATPSVATIADTLNRHQARYGAGFYCGHGRFFIASVVGQSLQVSDFFGIQKEIPPEQRKFTDHNGRTIIDGTPRNKQVPVNTTTSGALTTAPGLRP